MVISKLHVNMINSALIRMSCTVLLPLFSFLCSKVTELKGPYGHEFHKFDGKIPKEINIFLNWHPRLVTVTEKPFGCIIFRPWHKYLSQKCKENQQGIFFHVFEAGRTKNLADLDLLDASLELRRLLLNQLLPEVEMRQSLFMRKLGLSFKLTETFM